MQYVAEINPFFEALSYLTSRFTSLRTVDKVAQSKPPQQLMTDDDWAYFARISELEQELDSVFMPDELMEHYFKPLKIKNSLNEPQDLSLGSVLLSDCGQIKAPLSIESFIDYYRSTPLSQILIKFYGVIITSFINEPEEGCSDIKGFMAFLDSVLVEPQSKWDLMDIATDPIKHIERLRSLVESIAEFIELRSNDYKKLILRERELFFTLGSTDSEALISLGFDMTPSEVDRFVIYPSLLHFTTMTYVNSETDSGSIRLYLGVFMARLVLLRTNKSNTIAFMNMLKLLSDETRFNALHDMRNRYSYGQELADKFKCTRNTMYYHLEKMMGTGLIRCHQTEYRMLYTMNKKTVYEKLTSLRDYLTDGWKPGDPDEPEEGGE